MTRTRTTRIGITTRLLRSQVQSQQEDDPPPDHPPSVARKRPAAASSSPCSFPGKRSKRPGPRKMVTPPTDHDSVVGEQHPHSDPPLAETSSFSAVESLPRRRELELQQQQQQHQQPLSQEEGSYYPYVMGIDEAGRGPLAGPVVAAAVLFLPLHNNTASSSSSSLASSSSGGGSSTIPGITDSKKITTEARREALYELLVQHPQVRWTAAVVDAATIDRINILQATLLAMRMAATALLDPPDIVISTTTTTTALGGGEEEHLPSPVKEAPESGGSERLIRRDRADIAYQGCYVVYGDATTTTTTPGSVDHHPGSTTATTPPFTPAAVLDRARAYALVDGNRVPPHLPCAAEYMVHGDAREYIIAAASVVAKVTRDRLMQAYDQQYPAYQLAQHKGYPTAAHRTLLRQYGPCPIHRRTFAPFPTWFPLPKKEEVAAAKEEAPVKKRKSRRGAKET